MLLPSVKPIWVVNIHPVMGGKHDPTMGSKGMADIGLQGATS
jgi:hypothetical protein